MASNKQNIVRENKSLEELDMTAMANLIYPVGSVYFSVNNVNPSTLFGGTWEQLKDRFLLGAGDTYKNGDTGGEATHKLTINEMPSHTHTDHSYGNGGAQIGGTTRNISYYSFTTSTGATGGDQPHNNMPPYLTVFMWKRTA